MITVNNSKFVGGAGLRFSDSNKVGGLSKSLTSLINSMFANGEQGFTQTWDDTSILFQDSIGSAPLTAVNQPVGLVLSKDKGLALGNELIINGDFGNGTTGWVGNNASLAVVSGRLEVTSVGGQPSARCSISTVIGKHYVVYFDLLRGTTPNANQFRVGTTAGGNDVILFNNSVSGNKYRLQFIATTTTTYISIGFGETAIGQTSYWDNISIRELAGNHSIQSTSAARPLLRDSPRRIDYDGIDDKLITTLPSALTGCTVIRSIPGVGTNILSGQSISTPYDDALDNCGLIVINRDLTPAEVAQITVIFNRFAGV